MNKTPLLIIFILVFLYSFNIKAETKSRWKARAWENIKSPISTPARKVVYYGIGLTTLLILFKDKTSEPLQKWSQERKPLGDFSKYGDYAGMTIPNALYAGAMYYHYTRNKEENKKSLKRTLFMLEATTYSGLFTISGKLISRRERPNSSNTRSFPSGHATTAFAFASVIGLEHSTISGVLAYSLATFVALSRINDNAHYLHDVTAGATVGISYGLGIYYKQYLKSSNSKEKPGTTTIQNLHFLPSENLDGGMLYASIGF